MAGSSSFHGCSGRLRTWLRQLISQDPDESRVALWAAVYYFSLMCSYFIIKPLRDEMGVVSGVENLQYLFTATFLVMLLIVPVFGWISSRYSREQFLPFVYGFFICNILLFFVLFKTHLSEVYVARIFYVWVSVFNLFVVSVFWSFMSEIFTSEQAKRLFTFIAAGGTIGGIAGPAITTGLVTILGPENLLIISGIFLGIALYSIHRLHVWHLSLVNDRETRGGADSLQPVQLMNSGIMAGVRLVFRSRYLLGICSLILLYTALATFLYFQQLTIVDAAFDEPAKRTAIFGIIELFTNGLTLFLQFIVTRKIVKRFGMAPVLALIPFLLCFGFLALWIAPVLGVIITVQVIRRAGNYAITRPMREMLYVVLSKEEKYKAKNFIDTAIYRGGDMASAWLYSGLSIGLGLSLSTIALLAVPICGIWTLIAFKLGKSQESIISVPNNLQSEVYNDEIKV